MKVSDFGSALETAMAENLREIDAMTADPAPPDFQNTIEALERSGDTFNRVGSIYDTWANAMLTEDFQAVQAEMDSKIAAHNDKIIQNAALFQRIEAVYNSPEKAKWTTEQQGLVWVHYDNFVRKGARLEEKAKARVGEINQRLAALYASFRKNLLADETGLVLYLKQEDLSGLPQPLRDSAAAAAEEKGHKGEWAILSTRSSAEPFLTYSDRRDLREKVWRTFFSRGDNGDEHDNNKNVAEIVLLRAEKAHLLGYPTFAHWRLSNLMAKTPDQAMNLLLQVWPSAIARVSQDVTAMQAVADKEGAGVKIAPWDYRYYAEKVRKAQYGLDLNEIKPYLQLDKLRDAMFCASSKLYGFQYKEICDVPTAFRSRVEK